jgi:hypothetical protein
MPRNPPATAVPADALVAVLRAVADADARRWLRALLTCGEAAEVTLGARQSRPEEERLGSAPQANLNATAAITTVATPELPARPAGGRS